MTTTKTTEPRALLGKHLWIVAAVIAIASCVGGGVAADLHYEHTSTALEGVAGLIVIWLWVRSW